MVNGLGGASANWRMPRPVVFQALSSRIPRWRDRAIAVPIFCIWQTPLALSPWPFAFKQTCVCDAHIWPAIPYGKFPGRL